MDPCDPGIDIKNARSDLHIKMGIPKSLVRGASRDAICLALKRCKRANGMAMPPMDYDRVGKHRIYYNNPRGIDLKGKDYKDLLIGKPAFKVLKRIADKLGLVSDDKDTLKGLIIKRLKAAGAPEPLMVPIKKTGRAPPTVSVSLNTLLQKPPLPMMNSRPLPATMNGLKNRANTLLQKPPSMEIAKNLSKNISSPQVRRNVAPIQRSFNQAVVSEQRLQQVVQKPGVTKEELKNAIKKVQQTQIPQELRPLNRLRLARVENMRRPAAPTIVRAPAAPTIVRAPAASAPVPQSQLVSLAKKQENVANIEKVLRSKYGNFSGSRNNLVLRAIKNASNGNKNAIKLLSNMNRGQLRVIQRRAQEAETTAERAQNGAEAAQERAENANNMKEMAKAAAEATEKSKKAIIAIKAMVGAQSEANDMALLKAMKISNANNTKRENLGKLFADVNKNYLNKIIKNYESTGTKFKRTLGISSTGNQKKQNTEKEERNNALRELRNDTGAGPAGTDQNIIEMAIKDKRYLNTLKKVDPKLLKKAVKKVYGEGRFFKNNGQKAYLNALMKASNVETTAELAEPETNKSEEKSKTVPETSTNASISKSTSEIKATTENSSSKNAAINYGKETNKIKQSIEKRIENLGSANNKEEINGIRKMITEGGLGSNQNRTIYSSQLNAKIKELKPSGEAPAALSAENVNLTLNENNNTPKLQGILTKLRGAPSGSSNKIENKLNSLTPENKKLLQNVNTSKLSNNNFNENNKRRLASAKKAVEAVTEAT